MRYHCFQGTCDPQDEQADKMKKLIMERTKQMFPDKEPSFAFKGAPKNQFSGYKKMNLGFFIETFLINIQFDTALGNFLFNLFL